VRTEIVSEFWSWSSGDGAFSAQLPALAGDFGPPHGADPDPDRGAQEPQGLHLLSGRGLPFPRPLGDGVSGGAGGGDPPR